MAQLTRTTFQPTAARVTPATVRGARQPIIKRVSNQVARRAARQALAAKQPANAPALAAPGGLVQRPGGEPLRPRATQATGATPVGAAVQYNQGIATGQPLAGGRDGGVAIDMSRAILVTGDPNGDGDTVPRITPRSRVDLAVSTADNTAWYWDNAANSWVAIGLSGGGIVIGDQNPVEPGAFDGQGYFARLPGNLWVWRTAFTPTEENPGDWLPIFAPNLLGNGTPDPAFVAGAINGQAFLNRDSNELFLWDDNTEDWVGPVGGGGSDTASRLVLASTTLDMTIPSNSLTGVILDFDANGFSELRDDLGYYDPANPTRITFTQAGAYRCTFKAIFDNLDTLNSFTNWQVTMRLNGLADFDGVTWTSPRGDLNPITSDSIQECTFYLQASAGQFATLDIQQANDSASDRFVYYQKRSFFTVEKIA